MPPVQTLGGEVYVMGIDIRAYTRDVRPHALRYHAMRMWH